MILNQLLYFAGLNSGNLSNKDLSLYDIYHLTSYDKSLPTLRKRLASLEDKGLIIKYNRVLYGKTYYRPAKNLYIENPELITMIEGRDLNYGDYYTAAILNYFRQKMLSGEKHLTVSHRELKELLRMDKSRLSVRARIKELLKNNIIKGSLNGRVYDYELTDAILNDRSPEVINAESDKLCEFFGRHLTRLDKDIPGRMKLSFQRMLYDGFEYNAIKHIVAYLGYKRPAIQSKITQVSHIRKHYAALYEEACLSVSRRKAHIYLYKLCSGFFDKPEGAIAIENETPATAILPETPAQHTVAKPAPTNEELWEETLKWWENHKGLIIKFYHDLKNTGMDSILEIDDVYSSIIYIAFEHLKKNPANVISLSSNYLKKCVRSILINSTHQSAFDTAMDITDTSKDKEGHTGIRINERPFIDEENRCETIKRQIQSTGISEDILNIVADSLALNGVRYTQRDLADKHNKSLSKINRILKKYIPILREKLENPDPPLST